MTAEIRPVFISFAHFLLVCLYFLPVLFVLLIFSLLLCEVWCFHVNKITSFRSADFPNTFFFTLSLSFILWKWRNNDGGEAGEELLHCKGCGNKHVRCIKHASTLKPQTQRSWHAVLNLHKNKCHKPYFIHNRTQKIHQMSQKSWNRSRSPRCNIHSVNVWDQVREFLKTNVLEFLPDTRFYLLNSSGSLSYFVFLDEPNTLKGLVHVSCFYIWLLLCRQTFN